MDNPGELFRSLGHFYLADSDGNGSSGLAKAQEIVEVVLEVIPTNYMSEKDK